ncbi:hypothetical protein JCM10908_005645 [Rhodotorula pacifica]|uniref:AN1-type zinc finger protein n=1 Tax=Rhodotorula pacifica TaxID=1495444 RepID=UPI00316E5FC5
MASGSTLAPEVHCALPTCHTLDFLPLTCPHCSSTFCRDHSFPAAHACPYDPALRFVEPENLPREGDQVRLEVRDLLPDSKRHKAKHLDGDAGATADPAKAELKPKQAAALDKLRASFGGKKTPGQGSATTAKSAAKPVNPALELMRLKQRAVPADPKHVKKPGDVVMPDRLYLSVSFQEADGTRRGEEKPVWVSKTVSAGKALDLFADLFKVSNVNNTTSDPSKLLSLAAEQDPLVKLVLSDPLAVQIPNGGRAVLLKGHVWP